MKSHAVFCYHPLHYWVGLIVTFGTPQVYVANTSALQCFAPLDVIQGNDAQFVRPESNPESAGSDVGIRTLVHILNATLQQSDDPQPAFNIARRFADWCIAHGTLNDYERFLFVSTFDEEGDYYQAPIVGLAGLMRQEFNDLNDPEYLKTLETITIYRDTKDPSQREFYLVDPVTNEVTAVDPWLNPLPTQP